MCAFGVELTLPVHRRARQDPYAGGTTGRRAAGAHPGDPWGVPRADPTGRVGVGKGINRLITPNENIAADSGQADEDQHHGGKHERLSDRGN